eukprot:g14596.t1
MQWDAGVALQPHDHDPFKRLLRGLLRFTAKGAIALGAAVANALPAAWKARLRPSDRGGQKSGLLARFLANVLNDGGEAFNGADEKIDQGLPPIEVVDRMLAGVYFGDAEVEVFNDWSMRLQALLARVSTTLHRMFARSNFRQQHQMFGGGSDEPPPVCPVAGGQAIGTGGASVSPGAGGGENGNAFQERGDAAGLGTVEVGARAMMHQESLRGASGRPATTSAAKQASVAGTATICLASPERQRSAWQAGNDLPGQEVDQGHHSKDSGAQSDVLEVQRIEDPDPMDQV